MHSAQVRLARSAFNCLRKPTSKASRGLKPSLFESCGADASGSNYCTGRERRPRPTGRHQGAQGTDEGQCDQAKIGAAMVKGEEPFDLTKAQKIFGTFENTAAKAPALFPANSIDQATADDPYSASPDIWQNIDDFKAKLAKLGSDAKAASASVKDLDGFKAAFGNIGKNDCGGCHEKYRLEKS